MATARTGTPRHGESESALGPSPWLGCGVASEPHVLGKTALGIPLPPPSVAGVLPFAHWASCPPAVTSPSWGPVGGRGHPGVLADRWRPRVLSPPRRRLSEGGGRRALCP